MKLHPNYIMRIAYNCEMNTINEISFHRQTENSRESEINSIRKSEL